MACCASAAYLAHASNAFVLIPLAAYYGGTIFRQGARAIAIASIAAVLMATPWIYWQAVIQPGGDVLLRFALTGKTDFNARGTPIVGALVANMRELGLSGWLDLKSVSFKQLLSFGRDWTSYGEVSKFSDGANLLGQARVYDFFEVFRSIGVSTIGLLILPILLVRDRNLAGSIPARDAACVGLGTLLITVVCTFPEPITHVQAYGAILLCFMAGAWTISKLGMLTPIFVSASVIYWLVVWVWHPLSIALRFEPLTIAVFVIAVLLYGILLLDERERMAPNTYS